MRFKALIVIYLLIWLVPFHSHAVFIAKRNDLRKYCRRSDIVMIASTGRSGSTMLTKQIQKYLPPHKVLKTHLLPPNRNCFRGKILFIFSNPDQAAESALYKTLHQKHFGEEHFIHVETADRKWLKEIGGPYNQTDQDNLLSYDALGTYEHLKAWLHTRTRPTSPEKAQILAIKYEHLWDEETVQAIRKFLKIPHFHLPHREERGHSNGELFSQELAFKKIYNLGTETHPRYGAYDDARILWEKAPPFQYLKIPQTIGRRL
jgi:hypothetical protein